MWSRVMDVTNVRMKDITQAQHKVRVNFLRRRKSWEMHLSV
jgi:hypothetical protein